MPPKGESGRLGAPGDFPEHPLFPIEEGGRSFEVSFIQIARKEGGAMSFVPQVFRAEELLSLDQIVERFGGGTYELYARSNSPTNPGNAHRITKRHMVTLPGKPKPLDPSNATNQEEVAAGLRPSPFDAPKSQPGLMGDSGVLVAILQMNQQSAERSAQQSKEFMMLMMQMMEGGRKESAENARMMVQMMTTMSTSQQNSMMQMLPLLVQSKGGGAEEVAKYAELFKSLGFGKSEGNPEKTETEEPPMNVGEVLSNVAEIVKGAPAALDALKSMGPGGMPGSGQVALPPNGGVEPPPGSAAAVLAGKG